MNFRYAGNALMISALILVCMATAHAQSQLVPLITDKTPLPLPNNFAIPSSSALNQSGDYAFISGVRQSALFLDRAGESPRTLVMQVGDEVPGYPGSRLMMIGSFSLNSSGLLTFIADTALATGEVTGVVLTYDGTTFKKIVAGNDVAPDTGGLRFGRSPQLVGTNDAGDVAFTAGLRFHPFPPTSAAQGALFISPGGRAPVPLIGIGDNAPGMELGETLAGISAIRMNNLGEILYSATIQSGSAGAGLFIASTAGNRKVVATGDPNPSGGNFSTLITSGLLNNAGQVAFYAAGTIWINSPGTGISKAVAPGDPVPGMQEKAIGTQLSLQAFNDDGTIAFAANIPTVTSRALLRLRPGSPLEVVASRNQAAPGAEPLSFYDFSEISINAGGAIGFRANLQGGSPIGIYRQAGADLPAPVVLEGQSTMLPGAGKYSLTSSTRTRILDSGGVFFRADVFGGEADGGEFLVTGSDTRILMNTADELPDNARISLYNWILSAAGDYIGLSASRNGGGPILAIHNITTHTTSVIATQGDVVPGIGRIRLNNQNHFINAGGSLVFSATTVAQSPGWVLFSGSPGTGLTKIVATGDPDPATGRFFTGGSLAYWKPAPFNNAGQVVFPSTMSGGKTGIYVGKAGEVPVKIALSGESAPGGGSFTAFRSRSINQAGQVAFLADIGSGSGSTPAPQGIYVFTPGIGLEKIAATGDPGPEGTAFAGFDIPDFNNLGEVAFEATLTGGGPRGGVFVASSSASLTAVVLDGESAPAGGNFSIPLVVPPNTYLDPRPDVLINDRHDVVFRADLAGGSSDSGYFVRRGLSGPIQAVALQGQNAPGTTGVFSYITSSLNAVLAEYFTLDHEGNIEFRAWYQAEGYTPIYGSWHVKPDNSIEEILVRGTVAPEFGGGTAVNFKESNAWNSGGRYALSASIAGGTFSGGIFLFVPGTTTPAPPGTSVEVQPIDDTTGATPVTLTFDGVIEAGNVSLTTSAGGPAIPSAFALGDSPVFYNISSTAVFTGLITVCIDVSQMDFQGNPNPRLLHFENGSWIDVTVGGVENGQLCGQVSSLSPFVVATLPLTLNVTLTPSVLWPPNNKLVNINASIQVSGECGGNPVVELVSITCNEALKPDDIVIGQDPLKFQLRAGRSGKGMGRTYTIIYRATDLCGNSVLASAYVIVPHDQGKK